MLGGGRGLTSLCDASGVQAFMLGCNISATERTLKQQSTWDGWRSSGQRIN